MLVPEFVAALAPPAAEAVVAPGDEWRGREVDDGVRSLGGTDGGFVEGWWSQKWQVR